jgi:hypothetical protein
VCCVRSTNKSVPGVSDEKTVYPFFVFSFAGEPLARENPLRLDDLLSKALERNPKIKSMNLEAKASSSGFRKKKACPIR